MVEIILTLIHWICNLLLMSVPLALAYGFLHGIYRLFVKDKRHEKWMTLEKYWETYPKCKTGNGVTCFYCGSRNLRYHFDNGMSNGWRIHYCNQCHRDLYRT